MERQEYEKIEALLDQMRLNIYVTDIDSNEILFMNRRMQEDYHISAPKGRICWKVLQKGAGAPCAFCPVPQLRGEAPGSTFRWREHSAVTGKIYENYDSLILWDGRPAHMQQSYDITDMLHLEEEASRDALCGVWNRKKGKELLHRALEGLTPPDTCVLVLIDIDDLKHINDFFGHGEGDAALCEVCAFLEKQIREPEFIFRLSSDEFGVVLRDVSMKEAVKRVGAWREEIEGWRDARGMAYPISFSYGVSAAVEGDTVNELVDRADERMYEEKLRRRKSARMVREESRRTLPEQLEYPSQYLYDALLQSTEDYIYVCNMKTGLFRYSPAQVAAFDLPGEIVRDPLIYWRNIVHPDDWDRFYRSNMEISENKKDAHSVEFRARQRNGAYVWLRCRGKLVRDEYGEPSLFAGIMQRMGRQNEVDPLTQLFNRRIFLEHIRRGVRDEALERMAVLILDVDDFRQFNEMYSREFGDGVLRTMAQTIQALLAENASLYRLDNDRLGILIGNGNEEDVQVLFRRIQERLRQMKRWKARKIRLRLSGGCAFYPEDGASAEGLYQYADYAVQYAKGQGKNRLEIFTEEILRAKHHMLELVKELRDSVEHGFRGFYLHFQPQVAGPEGKMAGVEALARYRGRSGAPLSPVEFIPILESERMIYAMGLWVIRTAISAAGEWVRRKPDFTVSVNASALQLADPRFLSDLKDILDATGFPSGNLVVELTESCAVQDFDLFRSRFQQLRDMGIRVALDDFGTGYSSLGMLKNAPIDIVKIDRSFVKDILHSKFDATFIAFVVAICHDVGIRVCLEGVETEEEYALVREMGLDRNQGYYFGRPVEAQAITERLEREA